jgi:FkbM family methyltransferase
MRLSIFIGAARRRLAKRMRRLIHGRPRDRAKEYLQSAGPIELVVHVGAHVGQEIDTYEKLGVRRVVWIEGDPATFDRLCKRIASAGDSHITHIPICALVSDTDGLPIAFHRFNNQGASSSVYRPTQRLRSEWPGLDATGEALTLYTRRLETILDEVGLDWPSSGKALLVVDVQGHEAAVLAGVGRYAERFDICECEVSKERIYEGGVLYPDIKAALAGKGYFLASHAEADVPWHGNVIFRRDAA